MIAIAIPRKEFGTRAEARTKEVERCLAMNPDYILFLDSDQTMPDKSIELMKLLDVDIAVIDTPPHDTDLQNFTRNPDGTISHTTIACSLIRPSVFDRIEKPWFSSRYNFIQGQPLHGKYSYQKIDKYQDDNVGEDIYFVRKCVEAGVSIEVIPGLKCNHFKL